MFYAYSNKYNMSFYAGDVTDLSDTFKCLNPECSAEYFLKAINSKRSTHFCKKISTDHIKGCIYETEKKDYIEKENTIIKSDIIDIYSSERPNLKTTYPVTKHPSCSSKEKSIYIRTPKQLLYFCISNPLSTIYKDKITVNDIVVDERNLNIDAKFRGFSGLKLLIGNTVKYNEVDKSILLKVAQTTKNKKEIFLSATIFFSEEQFLEVKKYILDTYPKFSGHQIAVLEEWHIDADYNIHCNVTSSRNVIYRFAN